MLWWIRSGKASFSQFCEISLRSTLNVAYDWFRWRKITSRPTSSFRAIAFVRIKVCIHCNSFQCDARSKLRGWWMAVFWRGAAELCRRSIVIITLCLNLREAIHIFSWRWALNVAFSEKPPNTHLAWACRWLSGWRICSSRTERNTTDHSLSYFAVCVRKRHFGEQKENCPPTSPQICKRGRSWKANYWNLLEDTIFDTFKHNISHVPPFTS